MDPCLLWSACDLPRRGSVLETADLDDGGRFSLEMVERSAHALRILQHHVLACAVTTA